jgi:ABC-2 type transport system ATP-binding protein
MRQIYTSHLIKRFKGITAVDDLNLDIAEGEIYGLLGPDGAGKTTTIRLLAGALRPEKGAVIQIAGIDMLKQTEKARSHIGYLPQRFSLYDDLTVIENIRFFAEARGLPALDWKPRCMEILNFVGLDAFVNRRAGQLSGGMRQKLGLAAALVHRPQVLLLDEPTTGVDPVTRQDFWQLIIQLVGTVAQVATTVLISTPYMDEASRCTRIGMMRNGRLQAEGCLSELLATYEGDLLEVIAPSLFRLRRVIQAFPGVESVQMFGDRLHLRVKKSDCNQVRQELQAWLPEQGYPDVQVRQVAPTLEDVFISLLEDH